MTSITCVALISDPLASADDCAFLYQRERRAGRRLTGA